MEPNAESVRQNGMSLTAAPNPKKVVTLKKANIPTETSTPEPVVEESIAVTNRLPNAPTVSMGGVSATIDPSRPDKPIKGVL